MDKKKQDEIFIKGLKDKDAVIFGQLFACYHARLFRFAESYLFDAQATEDVIQEVFIKLWEMQPLNIDRSLKAYLFLMVKNRCIDHLRSLQVEDKNRRKLFEAQAVSDSTDIVLDERSEALIKKTINEMPEQCKQVYQLSVFQNLKYQEIATELNISVSAVKVQMFRARKYLKEHLGGLRNNLSVFLLFRITQYQNKIQK